MVCYRLSFLTAVVVLWASPPNIKGIFAAVDRIQGAAYDIQWIASDTALYLDFDILPAGHKTAARGLFAVSPFPHTDAGYKAWLSQWYPDTEFVYNPIGLVIDSVHAYMGAFSLAHQDKCGGQSGMCEALASIQGTVHTGNSYWLRVAHPDRKTYSPTNSKSQWQIQGVKGGIYRVLPFLRPWIRPCKNYCLNGMTPFKPGIVVFH